MAMRRCDADEHHYDDSKHASCPYCRSTVPFFPDETPPEPAPEPLATHTPEYAATPTRVFGMDNAQVPVVGWVVIVSAPKDAAGRDNAGRDLRLIPGMNRVGRSPDMEVSLDFGDAKIGRDVHCAITFDPESNAFFLQGGQGRNLTYVLGAPTGEGAERTWEVVLQPRQLGHMDNIKVGETVLVFVPLCSDLFRWSFDEGSV